MNNCKLSFVCSKDWNQLIVGADPSVRHCESCKTDVHAVYSDDELEVQRAQGHCVAIFDCGEIATMGIPNFEFAPEALDPIFFQPTSELGLPPDVLQALEFGGAIIIGQVLGHTEVSALNLLNGSLAKLDILKESLASRGLTLGMNLDAWRVLLESAVSSIVQKP